MSSGSLKNALDPLFLLSKKLDKELPSYNKQFQRGCFNHSNDGINELQNLTKEVNQLHTECKETFLKMEAESKVFGDLQKCLNQSYELADACVSIIEAKLSLKGFEPSPILSAEAAKFSTEESSKPIQLPNVTREKHGGSAKIEVQPSNHFQEIDDRTIIIEPVIAADTSSADMKQCSNEAAYNKVLFDIPESPQLPELIGVKLSSSNQVDVSSPEMPTLDVCNEVSSKQLFQKSLSKQLNVASSVNILANKAHDEIKTSSFFPDLSSPLTPELKTISNTKSRSELIANVKIANKHTLDDDDDDDLVMHSRPSLVGILQENSPDTEDLTVHRLRPQYVMFPAMTSPDTPVLEEIRNNKQLPTSYATKVASRDNLTSPETPDLSVLKPTPDKAPPMLTCGQYDGLSSDVKRLVSYEQACRALQNCYELAQKKNSRFLSTSELKEAIGLGGRTKCSFLMLRTLRYIEKVVGSDMYEICH